MKKTTKNLKIYCLIGVLLIITVNFSGCLQPIYPLPTLYYLLSIQTGNFDGDNKSDIVWVSDGEIWLIDGNGKFIWKTTYYIPLNRGEVAIGDLDGDKKDEIVISASVRMNDVWKSNTTYAIKEDGEEIWKFTTNVSYFGRVFTANLNNDEKKDVIVDSDKGLYAIKNDGSFLWYFKNPSKDSSLKLVDVFDFHNDGIDEIIAQDENGVYVIDNNGNVVWFYSIKDVYVPYYQDGSNIIVSNYITIVKNKEIIILNSNGTFLWNYTIHQEENFHIVESGDINKDGEIELIISIYGYYNYSYYHSLFVVNKEKRILWQKSILISFPLKISDINNDGYSEIIGRRSEGITILGHNGEFLWNFTTGSLPRLIAIGNINNDSFNDIIVGTSSGTIYAISNDGKLLWKFSLSDYEKEEKTFIPFPNELILLAIPISLILFKKFKKN